MFSVNPIEQSVGDELTAYIEQEGVQAVRCAHFPWSNLMM